MSPTPSQSVSLIVAVNVTATVSSSMTPSASLSMSVGQTHQGNHQGNQGNLTTTWKWFLVALGILLLLVTVGSVVAFILKRYSRTASYSLDDLDNDQLY